MLKAILFVKLCACPAAHIQKHQGWMGGVGDNSLGTLVGCVGAPPPTKTIPPPPWPKHETSLIQFDSSHCTLTQRKCRLSEDATTSCVQALDLTM